MAASNRSPGNRSKGFFLDMPHRGKSFGRVCDAFGRPSFSCPPGPAYDAHPRFQHQADHLEIDPKGPFSTCPMRGSRLGPFATRSDDLRSRARFPWLETPIQDGGIKSIPWESIPRVLSRVASSEEVVWARLQCVHRLA